MVRSQHGKKKGGAAAAGAGDRRRSVGAGRGTLARPLDMLVFLLPLIVFHELASSSGETRVIAFDFFWRFLELFGHVGVWMPGLAVVVILLATQAASGESWSVRWNRVGLMYVESAALAAPLLVLNWTAPLVAFEGGRPPLFDGIVLGIGAGVYEELVFRLILISALLLIGADALRFPRRTVAIVAVIVSSLAFAAHHHKPIGVESFDLVRFVFRTIAGGYLALVFWYRGYGPAAGCHAAYNVALVTLTSIDI